MSVGQIPSYELFIGGREVASASGRELESVNPTTGEAWYTIPDADAGDVDRAVRAAREAFESKAWRGMSPTQRGRLLRRAGERLGDAAEELALLESRDNGKLIRDTRALYANVPVIWEYFAGWADKVGGEVVPTADTTLNYLRREPVGVVAAIVPWNSPVTIASNKIAAALAMGNTVVLKPSEITSAGLLLVARLLSEAGIPDGVVNVVTGTGAEAGDALVSHPGVDLITFTGGQVAGTHIAQRAAERHARVIMELGGKSPNIVFDDADPDKAATGLIAGIFAAAGQACTAGSRAYLHRGIYDEVLAKVTARAEHIKLGDPLGAETEIGPVAYEQHLARIMNYVELGKAEGARLTLGGRRVTDGPLAKGFFIEPTIFEGVRSDMRILREEIFGPVLSVVAFDTEDEVVAAANDSPFGLVAGVWTKDVTRAHRVAQRLDAGVVWINTYRALSPIAPFGGFKGSGYGKEGGLEGVLGMTRLKSIWLNLSEAPSADPFIIQNIDR